MKIFITGATGFIGAHLCRRLIKEGYEITALIRSPKKRSKLPESVNVIKGDLSIFEDKNLKLPHFDIVIHLAGIISAKSTKEYFDINYESVRHLADHFQAQKRPLKRLLFASSLAAAGPSDGYKMLDETMPLRPVDDYGAAKKKAEEFLDTVSFPVTSFRPAIVLGPGDDNSLTLFKMAEKGIGFKVAGQQQTVSFVDIDDVVSAILCMLTDERSGHQRYFIAHETPLITENLFRMIGKKLGKDVLMVPVPKFIMFALMKLSVFFSGIFGIKNQLDPKQYQQIVTPAFVCSGKKLTRELGWDPKYDLSASLNKAIQGYRKTGDLKT